MSEGQVAGRLEVIVESSLRNFGKKLKKKVEAASEGVDAEVGVKIEDKDLRKELEAKVKEAAEGIQAVIGVDFDAGTLKAKVEAAARAAASSVTVSADADGLVRDTARAQGEAQAAADADPIRVPLKTRFGLLLEALRERAKAQAAVDSRPITVPVKLGGRRGLRGLVRGGLLVSIASLIEPAVGAIGQAIGGISAMVGSMAPAVGTLAAVPVTLSAIVQGAVAGKVALGGLGNAFKALNERAAALESGQEITKEQAKKWKDALDGVSPSALKAMRAVLGLKDQWVDLRKNVQEALFSRVYDEIKPLANTLLPVLEKGWTGTADAIGRVVEDTAKWAREGRTLDNLGKIGEQNNKTLLAGGTALRYLLDGLMEFQAAAGPFQARMDRYVTKSAKWFRDTMRLNRENGDTAAFLEKAGDRLRKVWNITKTLGSGVMGIFRAADGTGMRLLNTFQKFLTRWDRWVNSLNGQQRIAKWFRGTEAGFVELSRLIGDTFVAIAKWAEDPKIARLLRMIRTELGPALNDFLIQLSDMMGENVVNFFVQFTRLLNNLAPAIEVVSDLTGALIDFVGVLNDLMEAGGGATDGLLKIAGALLVFSKARKLLFGARAVAGAAGGGGLLGALGLGALLGRGRAASQAAQVAGRSGLLARIASGITGVGGAAGSTGGILSKFARSPLLRKAGWAGMALSVYDVGKDWVLAGRNIESGARQAGRGSKNMTDSIALVREELGRSRIGEYADQYKLDLDRMARSIVKGTDYAKNQIKRVNRDFANEWGGFWKGMSDTLPGASKPQMLTEDLNKILGAYKDGVAKAKEVSRNRQQIGRLLTEHAVNGKTPGPVPFINRKAWMDSLHKDEFTLDTIIQARKRMETKVANNLLKRGTAPASLVKPSVLEKTADPQGLSQPIPKYLRAPKPVKVPAPKIDTSAAKAAAKKAGKEVGSFLSNIFGGPGAAKPKPVKIPKADTSAFERSLTGAKKTAGNIIGNAKPKPMKIPKADTKPLEKSLRGVQKTAGSILGKVKPKPIKLPKVDSGAVKKSLGQAAGIVEKQTSRAAKDADKNFSKVGKAGQQGGQQAAKGMQKGMTSLVGSIRKAAGPAKAGATSVANNTKSPFQGLPPVFQSIGANAIQGLRNGMAAQAGAAIAQARSIAAQIEAAARVQLKTHSPSRVMHKVGEDTAQGLANGLKAKTKTVRNEARKLAHHVAEGARLRRKGDKDAEHAEKNARREERAADRSEKAKNRISKAQKQANAIRKELTKGLVESAKAYGSLTQIQDDGGGFLTAGFAISELQRKVKESKAFRRNLRTLKKRGLGDKAYRQLLEAGVQQGGQIAKQLLDASPKQIKQINRLQNQLAAYAAKAGKDIGNAFKRVGENAGKGLKKGADKGRKHAHNAGKHLGNEVKKGAKKALRSHSPSREMFDIGVDAADGLVNGLESRARRLRVVAQGMGRDLTKDLHPAREAERLHRAARAGNARNRLRDAVRRGQRDAPLIGELTIVGKNREEVRDALEEVAFTFRKIRSGGVHADAAA